LVPASDGGDDFVGIGSPHEGLGVVIGFLKETVDGGLEINDRSENPAFEAAPGQLGEKKPSTALSQEAEVGVK
jgi:hypothetical protein